MWVVLALVVLLVAAGITAWSVLGDDGDGSPAGSRGGDATGGANCSGEYCVGPYPYVNACGLLDPSSTSARIGAIGNEGLRVRETFADPLPPADAASPPAWTFGVRSTCDVRPVDYEKAVFRSLTLELEQYGKDGVVEPGPAEPGRPLPGVEGVVVQDGDGAAEVLGWVRNTRFRMNLVWSNKKPAIPDATLAALAAAVVQGVPDAPDAAADLGDLSQDGRQVVIDACTAFTGADFQDATGYAVDPTNVDRTYGATPAGPITSTCRRTTAAPNRGLPTPGGTTHMDGALSPNVTVTPHPDDAAARAALAEDRRDIQGAVDVPGVGDGAVFGVADSSSFRLEFTKGFHRVRVDCGLTNGNADWTPADMRERLEPIAAAIAARMP
ncbi:hypothetical protein [Saccharothrix yanglingensis]|uniref:LigA protein n=1 Tax=Saccharothrix yanglingensis TaxID=659496 RepID=A0ABU0X3K3_9PSEU|nr:hypothetical protein [Saccharothrix yanglingensis]MDQ2586581.1 hypothetical protein [Saccharothrix yanglingensis]